MRSLATKDGHCIHRFGAQPQKSEDKEKLFVIKVDPYESTMQLKLKLKNMELWMCDYNYME